MKRSESAGELIKYEAPQLELIELILEGSTLLTDSNGTQAPAFTEDEW